MLPVLVMRRGSRVKALCASIAYAIVAAACNSNSATQFTVGVMSQIIVPKELRSIRITASVGGDIRFCETYPVDDGKTTLPQSLALAPGGDPTRPVTVTVVGFEKSKDDIMMAVADDCQTGTVSLSIGTAAHILRRARQPYVAGRNLFVPMPLRYSCFGVDCATGETCKGGRCVTPDIDPKALPDFVPEILFGKGSTCFDPDVCLGDAVGPTVIDAGQCIYEIPPGSSVREVGLNVRAMYEGHGVEVLDLDQSEGFFLPDASKPNRFQLATGLCHPTMMGGRQVVNVNASRSCASKNVYQPLCATAPRALAPSRSALYVLMDRESAMSEYVGSAAPPTQALDLVLKIVLGDPVFSTTTSIALKLIGNSTNACTSSYATPDAIPMLSGFTDMWKAADPIASYVQNAMTIAGLQLAADRAVPDATVIPNVTNVKALLLVTNRDPTDAAVLCGGNTASAIAGLNGVRTYVMSLRRTGETPSATATRRANVLGLGPSATIISAEGPDATASQLAVLTGLGALVGDLASCLYDNPGGIDPLSTDVYFKGPGPTPSVPVPPNAACTAGSSADGWSASGATIRICGASCTALRSAIQLASQQTALKNAMVPSQGQQVLVFVRPK